MGKAGFLIIGLSTPTPPKRKSGIRLPKMGDPWPHKAVGLCLRNVFAAVLRYAEQGHLFFILIWVLFFLFFDYYCIGDKDPKF
jgi:hypothetical protein